MQHNRTRRKSATTDHSPKPYSFDLIDNLADGINSRFEIENRLTSSTLRKVIWFMLLAMTYIFFQHNFDSLIRKLDETEKIVKDKRAYYISKKSNYLFASKQSEIERKLTEKGEILSPEPPIKIVIEK